MAFTIKDEPIQVYTKHLQQTLMSNEHLFENPHGARPRLASITQINSQTLRLAVDAAGIYHPGETPQLDPILLLRDSSFFTIGMNFLRERSSTIVTHSVVRYVKMYNRQVQYVIHYDYAPGVPNHADHHLQVEIGNGIRLPRFDITKEFVGFPELLSMVSRDLY